MGERGWEWRTAWSAFCLALNAMSSCARTRTPSEGCRMRWAYHPSCWLPLCGQGALEQGRAVARSSEMVHVCQPSAPPFPHTARSP